LNFIPHTSQSFDVLSTDSFNLWFARLRDKKVKARITARLDRLTCDHFGDTRGLSVLVSELRFTFGGGIRVYYTCRNGSIILLLTGGNKATQTRDTENAKALAKEFYDEHNSI
jgi:putative addiction module killer protein